MNEVTPFVLQMVREATSSTPYWISTKPFKPGLSLIVSCVSVMTPDANNEILDVGMRRGGTDFYVETIDCAKNGRWYRTTGSFIVPSEWKLIVKVVSPATGRTINVNLYGSLVRRLPNDVYLKTS